MKNFLKTNISYLRDLKISNYLAKGPYSTETEPLKELHIPLKGTVAKWGDDNLFPDFLDNQISKSIDLEAGIQTQAEFAYGQRVATYIEEMGADGNLIRKEVIDADFEAWKEKYNFNEMYLQRAEYNYFRYANVFVEFSFDDKGQITHLFTKDAPYCRISTLNKDTGVSDYLYQSAQWNSSMVLDGDEAAAAFIQKGLLSRFPLIDNRNPIGFIEKRKAANKKTIILGYHIKDYSPGDAYYGKSSWYPLLNNEWLRIAAKAPALIEAYYSNGVTVRNVVKMNMDYFESSIEGWSKLDIDEQRKHIEELQESVEANLAGADKAYKTLFVQSARGQNNEVEYQYEIESLANPNKDSTILSDIQHISSVINKALRLDSSLVGGKADGSKEADAGSEKRVASNLLQQRNEVVNQQILYPLTIVKHINGWDKRLKFGMVTERHETLDKNPAGKVETL
jgi:hypothetical protein